MSELLDQLLSYLRASWRYRWYGVVFAWVAAPAGWIAVHLTPDRYEATARVYVDTQSVLRPLLAGVAVQPNVDQLVTMMSRTLISRPNLEKVLRMADMDIKIKTPELREELLSRLSKDVAIKSAGRENLYTISYTDKNPQEAKRVVQSLLTLFVEGSLGDKRKDSDSARRFIDEQLKAYGEKLSSAENAVTDFKRKNFGLMGTESSNYYSRVGEARNALSQATLDLKEAENGRDAIKRQLAGAGDMPSLLEERDVPEEVSNPEIDARIQGLQQKLDSLQLTYTEQHPDIVAIRRTMDQLKEQKKKETRIRKPSPGAAKARNPVFQQLSVSLAEAEATVASMKARVAEYERRFNELKAAASAVPQVEAEYSQLTRDYAVTKGNYEKLLARREQAQISGDMEANSSVIDFRVVDPPQVPATPSAPNRRLLISMVLFGSIAGGVGLAFLISQIRPTFNDERRLRDVGGLPVFGTVVMMWSATLNRRRKRGIYALLAASISLFIAYGAVMATLQFTMARG